MTKKKILSITCYDVFSGGEIRLLNSLNILSKFCEVYLLAPQGKLTEKVNGKVPVSISRGIGQLKRKTNKFWMFSLFRRFLVGFFEVFYKIVRLKTDLVQCNSETAAFFAVLPAWILRKKVVCELCCIIEPNPFWERLSRLLGKFIYQYIVASEAVKDRLVEIGHDPGKIIVLNGGTDTENMFNPEKVPAGVFREQFGFSSRHFLIGTVGSTNYLKGHHLFLEAARRIIQTNHISEDIRFLIIGGPRAASDLDYLRNLENYVHRNGLSRKVIFIGDMEREMIPYALRDLDVFVFCSSLPDAFPRVTVEAMAMRKIVVASRIGGVPEQIVHNRTGLLFSPGNVTEMSNDIQSVIKNHSTLRDLGDRARQEARMRFSNEVFERNVISVYRKLLKINSQVEETSDA